MKGFILKIRKAKNEDVIVTVLSKNRVESYYRFYGARHSILQLGNLIDFEVEGLQSQFMPRLRGISHIGFSWLYDNNRLLIWHKYIKLYNLHLKDTIDIDSFYYNLLIESAKKWHLQNPKRIICEDYIKILEYEGRLHNENTCYICEDRLEEDISLMRSLIPAHPYCIHTPTINKNRIFELFNSKKSIYLSDEEINYLHTIVLKGF